MSGHNNISQQIKSVIAAECGIKKKKLNNKTGFMSNKSISYFNVIDVLYTLEHKFHVYLPESDLVKYDTVGSLTQSIVNQLKARSK